jgi:hypothetical protein
MSATKRLPAGFHFDIPAEVYHADPCVEPSLSASIAKTMIESSPAHAKLAHPRFTKQPEADKPSRTMQIGSVAHKMILGRGADLSIIEAEDYLTKAAKAERDAAFEAGRLPILAPDYECARSIAAAFAEQIGNIPDCEGWATGRSEVVAIAQDPITGTTMRSMFDRLELHADHAVIWDIKTGDLSAAPWEIGRRVANMGYEIPVGFYSRVVELLRPDLEGRIIFRWVFIENDPPFAMTVAQADATSFEIGRRKTMRACADFARCATTGVWPRYPSQIITPEFPGFAASKWMDREEVEEEKRRITKPMRASEIAGPC